MLLRQWAAVSVYQKLWSADMRLCEKNAAELSAMLREKKCSAAEILADAKQKISETEPAVNAYITVDENAENAAESVDKAIADGAALSPLAGIPVAVKDNISTKGLLTTCGSHMLDNYVPPYDAEVITRLRNAGAVILGKTNMDEFAMGSASDTSVYGAVRNPINSAFSAGGSSGGSAAAVRSCEAVLALGSDTGGSVRQPAAFCGIVGFKPTYGTVSRYGLVAFASSLEQIGSMGRTVEDAAMLHSVISGYDSKDDVSAKNYCFENLCGTADMNGIRVGIPVELLGENISDDVKNAVNSAAELMERHGARISRISIPTLKYVVNSYYIISSAEASSNLARFDGVRFGHRAENCRTLAEMYEKSRSEGFGAEVRRRIMLGTFVLSEGAFDEYYKRAVLAAKSLSFGLSEVMNDCDVLLMPVYPMASLRLDEKVSPVQRYAADLCTVPANLSGMPAVSLPYGKNADGMPLAVQLMGAKFSDSRLLAIASAFEKIAGGEI